MLSDNDTVMGFSIGGFLPCLHIQERGLKQSCSQFTKALGWLPFREWLYSTECGINCQCWKSTGCTVDITLATGLGEVGSKLISAALILWPGCPRPSSLSQKQCFLVQINCLLHKIQRGLSSTSCGMEKLASSSNFLAILEEIENISVDLLADKEKKKRV